MPNPGPDPYPRRIYPLDAHQLSEEQIAVTFAMTSRRPEPFDQIAEQVSQEKAADFHERWVLGYGHASVAEHAVVHLAVENISRLACDTLEDNRLASYTEKSSRYQLLPQGYYYVPDELAGSPHLAGLYRQTCDHLFRCYQHLIKGCLEHLQNTEQPLDGERESTYHMRLRRIATDSCRAVLPAATMTNVGVTANARVLEHAISKLLSSELAEEQQLGEELREQGRKITPTLIKYADDNPYLRETARRQIQLSQDLAMRKLQSSLASLTMTSRPKRSWWRRCSTATPTYPMRKSGSKWWPWIPKNGRESSVAVWRSWAPTTPRCGSSSW
jgi:thymidylate synthase ThyX